MQACCLDRLSRMDGTVDVQSAWPLPGGSFDFLGDFDVAAPLDLFALEGSTDEAGSSGCITGNFNPQIISERNALARDPGQQKDKKATAKELNKRAQKRFRENQKVSPLRMQ